MIKTRRTDHFWFIHAIDSVNAGFEARRAFFYVIIAIINVFPGSFYIVRKWNIGDHEKRVADGSITYDYFNAARDKVEYSISKGRYGDMQAFADKLKQMGYTEVKLIDTTDGVFMSRFEALWMDLSGSTLLVGRKDLTSEQFIDLIGKGRHRIC